MYVLTDALQIGLVSEVMGSQRRRNCGGSMAESERARTGCRVAVISPYLRSRRGISGVAKSITKMTTKMEMEIASMSRAVPKTQKDSDTHIGASYRNPYEFTSSASEV